LTIGRLPKIASFGWNGAQAREPVKLMFYPGAYHAFDFPILAGGRRSFGHWLKYDADAALRSELEARDFLAAADQIEPV
jgi:hypothetical protein